LVQIDQVWIVKQKSRQVQVFQGLRAVHWRYAIHLWAFEVKSVFDFIWFTGDVFQNYKSYFFESLDFNLEKSDNLWDERVPVFIPMGRHVMKQIKKALFLSFWNSFYDAIIILGCEEEAATAASLVRSYSACCFLVALKDLFTVIFRKKGVYNVWFNYIGLLTKVLEYWRGKWFNCSIRFYRHNKLFNLIINTWIIEAI